MRSSLIACLLIAIAARLALAQTAAPADSPAARPTAILFVGNSFTYGGSTPVRGYNSRDVTDENSHGTPLTGGIPGIFKKFTDEAGLHYEVHVETVGGQDLEYHYRHALPIITRDKWDIMVLQGYSTEPLPEARGGKQGSFLRHAALLEQAVHHVRPETKVYLYETWAYPVNAYRDASGHLAALENMALDLRAGYRRAFTEDKHFEAVAPVGDAWLQAIHAGLALNDTSPMILAKPGQVNLWDTDDKHPSVAGSYLAALVLCREITGADVRKLGPDEQAARDLGIPPEVAVKLQTVAAETPTAQPHP